MTRTALVLTILLSTIGGAAAHAADAELIARGQRLAEEHGCIACHIDKAPLVRQDGTELTAPNLIGKPAIIIRLNLRLFRDGIRTSEFMNPVAADLKNDEISALGAYMASLRN